MDSHDTSNALKELHSDLARKYATHAARLKPLWRSLDTAQRAKCLKAGAMDGVVLKHASDTSLGNVYKFVPEMNLRDVTKPGSDFLLELLEHRATTSLTEQYFAGFGGRQGDLDFIEEMIREKNLRHVNSFSNCYTLFLEGMYAESYQVISNDAEVLRPFAAAAQARQFIPQSTGELIIQRQMTLLQTLNILIEDIMEEGSKSRDKSARTKKANKAASSALSNLTFQASTDKAQLSDIIASAKDQREDHEQHLALLTEEPVALAMAVNHWFYSRPELLPDDKGRRLPVHTDKYISGVFLDTILGAVKAVAVWDYLEQLLILFEALSKQDKAGRAIVLQELSNVCQSEYARVQAVFKRGVQTSSDLSHKIFQRVPEKYDADGSARVAMRKAPANLLRDDPQLYYVLHLCNSDTNPSKALISMKKLADLHRTYPSEPEKMTEMAWDYMGHLAVIIEFIHNLSQALSLPPFSRKAGQVFYSRMIDLDARFSHLKSEIDLRDLVVPIDNLLEPGFSKSALQRLDQFVEDKLGSKMGFLYLSLVRDCISENRNQLQLLHTKGLQEPSSAQLIFSEPSPSSTLTASGNDNNEGESKKTKEKTRPPQTSSYHIVPQHVTISEPLHKSQPLKVSSATAEVFSTIFSSSTERRGSVHWTTFGAAMADLGFSIIPKLGSVFTFYPPSAATFGGKPFTIHRPHQAKIEGYRLLYLARRLRRVYGWGASTFVTE